tara:strand:- start:7531 stop:8193 length:663 start_codon:yes stop_codon:yes gene_type:complete
LLLYRFFAKVLLGEIEMSKKNLLNEVRRFMKLANLDASVSSNFVTKLTEMDKAYLRDEEGVMEEEEEEEEEVEMDMPDMDMEMPAEDDEEEMDMPDMDMEMPEEEADEAVLTDDEADAIIALADKLRAARDEAGDAVEGEMEMEMDDEEMMEESEDQTIEEILDSVLGEGEETETLEEEEETETLEEEAAEETTSQVNEEELVQEVLRRVKSRLAAMSKE